MERVGQEHSARANLAPILSSSARTRLYSANPQSALGYTRVTLGDVVRRLIITAVIAVCIGASIAETFDSWDQTARDGNDTEANVLIAAMCVGIAFAVGTLVVVKQIRALALASTIRTVVARTVVHELNPPVTPAPASSPPAILRV